MTTSVRYIVHDMAAAVSFYERLGFDVEMSPGPGFALLRRDELRLLLNTPGGGGGAGHAMPDGSLPAPGGWNRIQLQVDDLETTRRELGAQGVPFRSEIIHGRGGDQVVADDPSGNPVELFQPAPRAPAPGGPGVVMIDVDSVIPFIDAHLDGMAAIVDQLGPERVNARPRLAGANSAFAIVTHCAGVTEWWLGYQVAGRCVERDRDAEFTAIGTVDDVHRAMREAKTNLRADCAVANLDEPITDPDRYPDDDPAQAWTKGQALLHVLDEIAQHHGHLDLTMDLLLQAAPP